jgi:hypothetical protein
MIRLTKSLNAWGTPAFGEVLKDEMEHLDAALLPLQQGLARGNYVSDGNFSVMILRVAQDPEAIHVTAGIFYSGIIAGCTCADDPTPGGEESEYCEVRFDIDRKNAETTVSLLPDSAA